MSQRERPFDVFSDRTLHLGELARVGAAAQRATNFQGPGGYNKNSHDPSLYYDGSGFVLKTGDPPWFFGQVTARDGSNPPRYAWTQVIPSQATFSTPSDYVANTDFTFPAYEANGASLTVPPPFYTILYKSYGPWLYFYKDQVQTGILPTAPPGGGTPSPGQVYFNVLTNQLFVWNGTSWVLVTLTASGGGGSSLQYGAAYITSAYTPPANAGWASTGLSAGVIPANAVILLWCSVNGYVQSTTGEDCVQVKVHDDTAGVYVPHTTTNVAVSGNGGGSERVWGTGSVAAVQYATTNAVTTLSVYAQLAANGTASGSINFTPGVGESPQSTLAWVQVG